MQTILETTAGFQIFVDGSYDPATRRGGWAFIVLRNGAEMEQSFGGVGNTDNGAMELAAVLNALIWLSEHAPDDPAIIWTDAIYAVNGCNKMRHIWRNNGWKTRTPNRAGRARAVPNVKLWLEIDQRLTANRLVTIEWCKGHSGISGNELADRLADRGRTENT